MDEARGLPPFQYPRRGNNAGEMNNGDVDNVGIDDGINANHMHNEIAAEMYRNNWIHNQQYAGPLPDVGPMYFPEQQARFYHAGYNLPYNANAPIYYNDQYSAFYNPEYGFIPGMAAGAFVPNNRYYGFLNVGYGPIPIAAPGRNFPMLHNDADYELFRMQYALRAGIAEGRYVPTVQNDEYYRLYGAGYGLYPGAAWYPYTYYANIPYQNWTRQHNAQGPLDYNSDSSEISDELDDFEVRGDGLEDMPHDSESSDEEEYRRIINNMRNASIDNGSGNNPAQQRPDRLYPNEPSQSRNWPNQQERYDHYVDAAGSGHEQQQLPIGPPDLLNGHEVYPIGPHYYFSGSDEVFQPVAEPVADNNYELGDDNLVNNNEVDGVVHRRPARRARLNGVRSASAESISPLDVYQDVQNWEAGAHADDNDEETQRIAQARPPSLTNSRSVPDLVNVVGLCPICSCDLNKKEVVSTYCGHLFCRECLFISIITSGKKCPKCRRPFQDDEGYHRIYF